MVIAGTLVVAAALLWGRRGPLYGATSLVMFGFLALLTSLSVLWSIVPELSYIEAGRTLTYLVIFAAAIAGARLAPRATQPVLGGILIGAMLPVAYAIASRIWPGTLAENELSNRLGAPFQYWNAVGTVAALAIPAALWLGSRRTGNLLARAAAYPAIGLCVLAILLTQSRGALAAAVIGAVIWFAVVLLRLRSIPVVLVPSLAAGAVGAWALSKDAFSKSLQPLAAKEAVAGEFGLFVLLLCLVLLAVGYAINMGDARGIVPIRAQRRIGVVAVVVARLVPLVAFTSVAFSTAGCPAPRRQGLGAHQRDRGRTGGRRRSRVRGRLDSREVLARGRPRVRRAAVDRGRRGLVRRGAPACPHRPGGHAPRARLRAPDDGRPRGARRDRHEPAAGGLDRGGAAGHRSAAAPDPVPGPQPRRGGATRAARLGRRANSAGRARAGGRGVRPAVDHRLDLVHSGPVAMALVAAGFVAGRGPLDALATAQPRPPEPPRDVPPRSGSSRRRRCCSVACWWRGRYGSPRPRTGPPTTRSPCPTNAATTRRSNEPRTPPTSTRSRPTRCWWRHRSTRPPAGDRRPAEPRAGGAPLPRRPPDLVPPGGLPARDARRPGRRLDTLRGALYLDPHSPRNRQLFLDARARRREQQTLEARREAERQAQRAESRRRCPGTLRPYRPASASSVPPAAPQRHHLETELRQQSPQRAR